MGYKISCNKMKLKNRIQHFSINIITTELQNCDVKINNDNTEATNSTLFL
jgi:hypothetical protein